MDMFAMFHCGRLDILPVGDLAVRKGFQALYNLKVMGQHSLPCSAQDNWLWYAWQPWQLICGECVSW